MILGCRVDLVMIDFELLHRTHLAMVGLPASESEIPMGIVQQIHSEILDLVYRSYPDTMHA